VEGICHILFSWSGGHLHCFHIHGKDYGTAYAGAVSSGNDPRQVRLSDFHLHRRERFLYQYKFTAGWELEIRIKNILPFDPARSYPICIGGKRAALGSGANLVIMDNRRHGPTPLRETHALQRPPFQPSSFL